MKSFENIKKILKELSDAGLVTQADTYTIRGAIIMALHTVCYKTIDSYFFGMIQAGILTKKAHGIWSIKNPFKEFIPIKKKGATLTITNLAIKKKGAVKKK